MESEPFALERLALGSEWFEHFQSRLRELGLHLDAIPPEHMTDDPNRNAGIIDEYLSYLEHQRRLREREESARHKRRTAMLGDLTPRQQEVAALLARGLKGREIAEELGIAPGTVYERVRGIEGRTGRTGKDLRRWLRQQIP